MRIQEVRRKVKDLKNQRFGRLTVLGEYITFTNTRNRTERKWLCRCDCGTEKYILERSLLYGNTQSCGCLKLQRATEKIEHKLKGRAFEDLEVIDKAEKKDRNGGTWWVCKCSCGNVIEVPGTLLVTGRKTHCGCKSDPQYHSIDITERKFDRLTAKYPLPQRDHKGGVIWHCVCECGNELDVPYSWLVYSNMRSCGCWKRERESKLPELLTPISGTSIDAIKSKKIRADSTTGVTGVYLQKGKYVAKIVFQSKQYQLGKFDDIDDAIKARKEAEELLFDGSVVHYERWKAKADEDPDWAKQNPVEITVSRKGDGDLSVVFLPVL